MPTIIPYNPSLTLMSVVDEVALKHVENISRSQAPADAAGEALDELVSTRRGLIATKAELQSLGVPTDAVDGELAKLDTAIANSTAAHTSARTAATTVPEIRPSQIESPVDAMRSTITSKPLAADSVSVDVEYCDSAAAIASFVSKAVSVLGPCSRHIGGAAAQIGTGALVLVVTRTHRNATVIDPCILHVDKAIKVWNQLFPGKKLDPMNSAGMMKCAMNESQDDREKYSIVAGTSYGSCFIGLLTSPDTDSLRAAAQHAVRAGFHGDEFAGIKSLDNTRATMLCMHASALETPRAIDPSDPTATMESFSQTHDLSIESMMTALEDYQKKAAEGGGGIPINFYLEDVDQKMLAQLWTAKYNPGQYMAIKYDDTEGAGGLASDEEKAKL